MERWRQLILRQISMFTAFPYYLLCPTPCTRKSHPSRAATTCDQGHKDLITFTFLSLLLRLRLLHLLCSLQHLYIIVTHQVPVLCPVCGDGGWSDGEDGRRAPARRGRMARGYAAWCTVRRCARLGGVAGYASRPRQVTWRTSARGSARCTLTKRSAGGRGQRNTRCSSRQWRKH